MNNTEIYNGLEFTAFTEQDIEVLTPIMKKAFDSDTKIHTGKNEGGPPGYDNGDFIRKWYFQDNSKSYKITRNGELIGGINVFINENGNNYS